MLLEENLRNHLLSDSGVGALVDARVYGIIAPQNGATPRVVFAKVADYATDMTMCGPSGLQRCVYQFDSYAKQYKEVLTLAKAIRTALVGFQGEMGDTHVSLVTLESEFHVPDPEPGLFRVSSTLLFWYQG